MTSPDLGIDIAAVFLAGGLARRMGGGDKGLQRLGSGTILGEAIARVRPQVRAALLNANGNPGRFEALGLPVVADVVEGNQGPLAGILSGLEWVRRFAPACRWVLSVPSDAPFLPLDLAARLKAHVLTRQCRLGCAASGGRTHPVVGLWPVDIADELRRALVEEGVRKIDRFTAAYPVAVVDWPTEPADPFFNANQPEDLAEAERLMAMLRRPPRAAGG